VVSGQRGRAQGFNPWAWGDGGGIRIRIKIKIRRIWREAVVGGESCGEVEGEGGFTGAGVAGEEGEFSLGEVVLPEPLEGLGWDVGEGESAGFGGNDGRGHVRPPPC
jgi:hypothetical protein